MNACTHYASTTLSLIAGLDLVFFGLSLVPVSVMQKTKSLCVIHNAYYERILKTLSPHPFLLAVFDNTQIGCLQKFQRKGVSNL